MTNMKIIKYVCKIAVIFLCCLFLFCCKRINNEDSGAIEKISVNLKKVNQELDISQFYNATFIPLELTKKSQIGSIDKVILSDNRIFVLDATIAKKLFVFDMKGNFLKNIGKLGKGKGEYLVIRDFDVYDEKVYISSQQDNRMLIFDLEGQHINDVKFSGYIGMSFMVLEDGFVVNKTDGSNKAVTFYDKKGKKKKIITNPGFDFMRFSNDHTFFKNLKGPFVYFAKNDTIYNIFEKNLKPSYFIDFGRKSVPYGKMKSIKILEDFIKNNDYLEYIYFNSFLKYYFLKVIDGKYVYTIIIDIQSKKLYNAMYLNYKGFTLLNPVGNTSDGPILTWGPPSHAVYKVMSQKKNIFIPECFKESSINANPGVVILTEK